MRQIFPLACSLDIQMFFSKLLFEFSMIISLIILKSFLRDTGLSIYSSVRKIFFVIFMRYPLFYLRICLKNILGKAVHIWEVCFLLVSRLVVIILVKGLPQLSNCNLSLLASSPISFLNWFNVFKNSLAYFSSSISTFSRWIFSWFISSMVVDWYKCWFKWIYFNKWDNSLLCTFFLGIGLNESWVWVSTVSF